MDKEPDIEPYIANIRQEWHWVKRGVEEILAEQAQLTYRPEDVYAACLNHEAILWVAPEGFVVSQELEDEFTGAKTLLIWLAWARRKRGQNCVVKYYPFFARTAKAYGFSKIETRSPIPALENYLITAGWEKDTVVYTRAL